ncbi:MAG: VWA domain-containing protein [Gammaproteobacteria bacterium]|nr:VWA domain-containing protein [Gammaproteobacteria bacterium]MBU1415194.1 VWA domain-containing protein [Gammaproteobacteria bacterium]
MNAALPAPLLWQAREARLAALDELPRSLWLWALIHSQGGLEPRLDGLAGLRAALLAGRLPSDWRWPEAPLAQGIADVLTELELPNYCEGQAELVELLLRSLMFHLDLIVDYVDRGETPEAAAGRALAAFRDDWAERCGEIDELVEVFGNVGELCKNNDWDMLRGLLKSGGWQEMMRIRRLMERLPDLAGCIRRLGRARATEEPDAARHSEVQAMMQADRPVARPRRLRVPDYPGETRGVHRSGRVPRMVPAEAVLLLHPRLRLVWHARHAERTLLTYEDHEILEEWIHEPHTAWVPSPDRLPERRHEMGPILVCVDTSGSMQGGAEVVAKAVVLEAVRTAHAQKRACHVFTFSGPGDLLEMPVAVDFPGLEALTGFMGQSFGGGTDVTGPLEHALEKLEERDWQLADLLVASDGEFGATPDVAARLRRVKEEKGLRVQGVLVGDRETVGFLEIADDILWVPDWRRFGTSTADGDSPIHSKSLTAIYFPGALRTPENRAATVTGADAATALRKARSGYKRPQQ